MSGYDNIQRISLEQNVVKRRVCVFLLGTKLQFVINPSLYNDG